MRRSSAVLTIGALIVTSIAVFQNCSVRRLSDGAAGLSGSGGLSGTGTGAGAGTGTGTTGTGSTAGGTSCFALAGNTGAITGLSGTPPLLKSDYAMKYGFNYGASASGMLVMIMSDSACYAKTDLTKALRCATPTPTPSPTPTPVCDASKKALSVSISLTCAASDTATTCSNFTAGQVINLTDLTASNKVTISVTNTANCSTVSYSLDYAATNRGGTIKILAIDTIEFGKIYKVQLTDAKLVNLANASTAPITLNGIFGGEILNIPTACTN